MKKVARGFAAVLAMTLLSPTVASAQTEVTVFGAYVGTSGLENVDTGADVSFKNSGAFSLVVSRPLDAMRDVQLFYSQQSTTLAPGAPASPFDLTIRHLHLGGTVVIDGALGNGPYAVGGIGATFFDPGIPGYGSEVRPSLNLGFGYAWPLGKSVAIRTETRGFITLVNSSGGFLCSGGCVVLLSGDAVMQFLVAVGLSARF